MYNRIGPGDPSLLLKDWSQYPIQWNPTGWGSCSIPVDHLQLPGVRLVTLLGLLPGGVIPPHKDKPNTENNISEDLTRYHLVLTTNPGCWQYHSGQWQQLEHGYLYTMDPQLEHASVNWGSTTRLHLILDINGNSLR